MVGLMGVGELSVQGEGTTLLPPQLMALGKQNMGSVVAPEHGPNHSMPQVMEAIPW
jgi:hypothetical protein